MLRVILGLCSLAAVCLAVDRVNCNINVDDFVAGCEPSYQMREGKCTTQVAFRKTCTNFLKLMNNDCKPCCDQWGVNGDPLTDCVEDLKFPENSCSSAAKYNACKVPIKGETTPKIVVLCSTETPPDICLGFERATSGITCKPCCKADSFRGNAGNIPHCDEMDGQFD